MGSDASDTEKDYGPPQRLKTVHGTAFGVPTQFFLDAVLPPLHTDINLDKLIDSGAFRFATTMQGKLWGYSKKSPSGIHGKDVAKSFESLQRGIWAIVKAVAKFKPTVVFRHNTDGARAADFESRTEDSLPDAFFSLTQCMAKRTRWTDTAVVGEYRRENREDDVEENNRKIAQSLAGCMRNDPRRRFVYGFTAEDANMRLWYCDRTQIVFSTAFNFVHDFHTLAHFVLSISFAELCELGWDPTMSPVLSSTPTQYDITVRSENGELTVYRTLELLSDGNAETLLSRGTRVWKAVKLVDGEPTGDPVALKDVWVDSSRAYEGDVLSDFFSTDFASKEVENEDIQKHFITMQTHGAVFAAGRRDRTPSFFVSTVGSPDPDPGVPTETQTGTGVHVPTVRKRQPVLQPLIHYRIVFTEVGDALSDATTLHAAFSALADAVQGLFAMHKSGWVHRDLSTGNILIVGGVGKISDLEYATDDDVEKIVGETKGTAYFRATEVDSGFYMALPERKREKRALPSMHDIATGRLTFREACAKLPPSPISEPQPMPPRLRYHPLHDLESLWWLAVYFVVCRELELPHQGEILDSDTQYRRQVLAHDWFYGGNSRFHAFRIAHYFRDNMSCLHRCITDKRAVKISIADILEDVRRLLNDAYSDVEKAVEHIDSGVSDKLYDDILLRFKLVAKISKKLDIRLHRRR
ncbi:hypothetical protein NM688_g2099 [Phlebia brevispora]|uniref:Uncharacterized protein n=1 Tax=Phlebia brevispora TaxID=194682 RepID=A0ACC1T9D0_9APHY|nr:hypothetical protein NM688_g2099 [Phlebia brevispora]